MKKIIVTLALVFVFIANAFANNDIIVSEGSLKPLKEGGKASVKINMTETTFDNCVPLRDDERYADIDKYIPEYVSEFGREFNEYSNKLLITPDEELADYTFVFDISNMDCYVKLVTFKPGVGTKLWGTMTILDKAGEKVAILTLDSFESSGFTYNLGLEETFEVYAKKLAKRINKGK